MRMPTYCRRDGFKIPLLEFSLYRDGDLEHPELSVRDETGAQMILNAEDIAEIEALHKRIVDRGWRVQ